MLSIRRIDRMYQKKKQNMKKTRKKELNKEDFPEKKLRKHRKLQQYSHLVLLSQHLDLKHLKGRL